MTCAFWGVQRKAKQKEKHRGAQGWGEEGERRKGREERRGRREERRGKCEKREKKEMADGGKRDWRREEGEAKKQSTVQSGTTQLISTPDRILQHREERECKNEEEDGNGGDEKAGGARVGRRMVVRTRVR